jgi:predicted alpha/beta superfamily hydrolase
VCALALGACAGGDARRGDDVAGESAASTTIRVHYPDGGHTIALRGSASGFTWKTDTALEHGDDDTWTWTGDLTDPIEFKPVLAKDDERDQNDVNGEPLLHWAKGKNNFKAGPGDSVDVYPRFFKDHGNVFRKENALRSAKLGNLRSLRIYLPPSYDENTLMRFPVVYMNDGQNLFDPPPSGLRSSWKIEEALDRGAADDSIREAIVVGVESYDRSNELPPTRDKGEKTGGKGEAYLQMVMREVKPLVDKDLRTLSGRENTAIVGSSLGGINALYAGVHYADVFGLVGVLSPATWWDDEAAIRDVAHLADAHDRPLRIYLDSGDAGPVHDDVEQTHRLNAALQKLGFTPDELRYAVHHGHEHAEYFWSLRAPAMLAWLLGPRDP